MPFPPMAGRGRGGRRLAVFHGRKTARQGAVFVGSHRLQGHELREIGFRSYFRDNAPSFEVLDTLVTLEKRQITYETTLDLMHGNLSSSASVWSAGAGGHQELREVRKAQDAVAIVNEITPESRSALVDGIVAMAVATPLRPALPGAD